MAHVQLFILSDSVVDSSSAAVRLGARSSRHMLQVVAVRKRVGLEAVEVLRRHKVISYTNESTRTHIIV